MKFGVLGFSIFHAVIGAWRPATQASFLEASGSRGPSCDQRPATFKVEALRQLPHDGLPFTQGLEFNNQDQLVETSGSFPAGTRSYIRGVDPATGNTLWRTEAGLDGAFIEGITRFGSDGHWFSTVYQTPHRTLEYDSNFNFVQSHPYYLDGWGFSRSLDGAYFLATNGSSLVMQLEPNTFEIIGAKHATCRCQNVPALNELELVHNFMNMGPALLGNVYTSRVVLALDLDTMECIGAFNLNSLNETISDTESAGFHVANGIAYRGSQDTYFLTGKNWNSMFEVRLEEDGQDQMSTISLLDDWLSQAHMAPGILSLFEGSRKVQPK